MEVALIAPYELQRELPATRYHLVLAHLLGTQKYRAFSLAASGHKILDNGCAEGSLVTGKDLIQLAGTIGAREIVVPDMTQKAISTMKMATEFRPIALAHPEFDYIGVIQGKTNAERLHVLEHFKDLAYMKVYALPRNMCEEDIHERAAFAAEAYAYDHSITFHALGSSKWCEEIKVLSSLYPIIRGNDTAMPIKMGLNQQYLVEGAHYDVVAHTKGYFESTLFVGDKRRNIIRDNVRTYLQWAQAFSS